jgi:Ca2+-binding RTX toxin-like protein
MTLELGDGNDTLAWKGSPNTSQPWGTIAADGSDGDDRLTATACWDCTVHGGPGPDVLAGDAEMFGDDSTDSFLPTLRKVNGSAWPPDIDGGRGQDDLFALDSTKPLSINLATETWSNRADAMAPTASLSSILNVQGSSFGDLIVGDGQSNTLRGAQGDDTIKGGAGGDLEIGGAGSDTLQGGPGDDLLDRTRDQATCGAGYDRFFADDSDHWASDCETRLSFR